MSNQRATHPVNAMLNYAYQVTTARLQVQLIADGYDPTIGILHDRVADRGNYPALALDHLEPLRPVVDRGIIELLKSEELSPQDFAIQEDGVCRVNPELARRVVQGTLSYRKGECSGFTQESLVALKGEFRSATWLVSRV